jgi:hypothetical protein
MGKRAKRDVLSDGPPSRVDEMRLVAADAMAAALEVMGRKGRGPDGLGEGMLKGVIAMAAALIERDAAVVRLAAARAERRTKPTGGTDAGAVADIEGATAAPEPLRE